MTESNEINNTIYDAVSNALENKNNQCITLLPSSTGKSTYDLAVDYGYVGTEREWLSSIANDTTVVSNLYADAQSFSDFMSKPSAVSVPRRLASSIHTLNYYLDYFNGLKSLYSQESGTVTVNGVELKSVRQAMNDAVDDVLLGEYQEGMRADLNAQKLDTGITATAKFGGTARELSDKLSDSVSVKDFGALGDGSGATVRHWHTAGSVHYKGYVSLEALQVDMPYIPSSDHTIDWAAVQGALNTGLEVRLPNGVYVCNDEVTVISHGQRIVGSGMGSGYTVADSYSPVLNWNDKCTLLFIEPVNANVRYIKTRALARTSTSDPQDKPLSAALNIQAESVDVSNLCVRLHIDKVTNRLNDSPNNLGADWDVGIFNGCRVHHTMTNVASIGYWREASIYYDVTGSSHLPKYTNHNGLQFPNGTIESGADGAQLTKVMTYGGKWGVKIQGAKGVNGIDEYPDNYIDAISGKTVSDARGIFGFSDFIAIGCSFYGQDHHTRVRVHPIAVPPNVKTDESGGALSIDGLAGNSERVIQGHRFIGCRFSTYSPYQIRLDCSNRDVFIGCHHETHGNTLTGVGGTVIPYNATNFYGPFAKSEHTRKTKIISSSTHPFNEYWEKGFNDVIVFSDHNSGAYDRGNFYGKTYNTFGVDIEGNESSRVVIQGGKDTGSSVLCFGTSEDAFSGSLRYNHGTGELSYRNSKTTNSSGRVFDVTTSGSTTEIKTPGNLDLISNKFTLINAINNDTVFELFPVSGNVTLKGTQTLGGDLIAQGSGSLFGSDINGTENNKITIRGGKTSGSSILCFGHGDSSFSASLRYNHGTGELSYRNETTTEASGKVLDLTTTDNHLFMKTPGNLGITSSRFSVLDSTDDTVAFAVYPRSGNIDVKGDVKPLIADTKSLGRSDQRWGSSYVIKRHYSSSVFDSSGKGTPEGSVSASVGSTYRRTDGGAGTTFYVKESGSGNTGWVAK